MKRRIGSSVSVNPGRLHSKRSFTAYQTFAAPVEPFLYCDFMECSPCARRKIPSHYGRLRSMSVSECVNLRLTKLQPFYQVTPDERAQRILSFVENPWSFCIPIRKRAENFWLSLYIDTRFSLYTDPLWEVVAPLKPI